MSWQSYVDDHLMCDVEGNHLTAAAILGQDGSVWAQSAKFPQVFLLLHPLFSPYYDPSLELSESSVIGSDESRI